MVKYSTCLVPVNFPTVSDISNELVRRKKDIRGRVLASQSGLSLNKLTVSRSNISQSRPESRDLHIYLYLREGGTSTMFFGCLFVKVDAGGDSSQGLRFCFNLASIFLQVFDDTLNTEQNCQSHLLLSAFNSTDLSIDLDRRFERSMFPTLFF